MLMVFFGVACVALSKTRCQPAFKCDTGGAVALLSHCRFFPDHPQHRFNMRVYTGFKTAVFVRVRYAVLKAHPAFLPANALDIAILRQFLHIALDAARLHPEALADILYLKARQSLAGSVPFEALKKFPRRFA